MQMVIQEYKYIHSEEMHKSIYITVNILLIAT